MDPVLDLNIKISDNKRIVFKIGNKTDDFNLEVSNFPFLESITYSAFYS